MDMDALIRERLTQSGIVEDWAKIKPFVKYARKLAFSQFVDAHKTVATEISWNCCFVTFAKMKYFHLHVSRDHAEDIISASVDIICRGSPDSRWTLLREPPEPAKLGETERDLPAQITSTDVYTWLPEPPDDSESSDEEEILLFYKYMKIHRTDHVLSWQKELCRRLNLVGKIRIAIEGINITIGGRMTCTQAYISAVKHHPLFDDMIDWDFKHSAGSMADFPNGLKAGIYQEIVPMGRHPEQVSFQHAGKHLNVDEFHQALGEHKKNAGRDDMVFVDCRNFYESKIGQFEGALCPDLRKFSYWPEYADANKSLFEKKDVYMYCTGGIRCERGSAYLLEQGLCKNVYQLHGGIHKYIEKYPDGYFRGKLFVFDDRYHIKANDDIISNCKYCDKPWDKYKPCTSLHCHQLVLSCTGCRESGKTACCTICQSHDGDKRGKVEDGEGGGAKEECECTMNRVRIPLENPACAN